MPSYENYTVSEFLKELYRKIRTEESKDYCFFLYDYLDKKKIDGDFRFIDDLICEIDIHKLTSFAIRSLLVLTYTGKEKLKTRERFYNICYQEMVSLKGKETTDKLLGRIKE